MAVQYVERGRVLSLLFDLMGTALSARERRALLLRCGFGLDGPMPFGQVAKTLPGMPVLFMIRLWIKPGRRSRAANWNYI